jgi:hypothetical protein
MGQYFRAVNKTKQEVVCPWCLGGGAKLWEWAANPFGAVFTLLLRRSDGSGGGDFYGTGPQIIQLDQPDPNTLMHAITGGVAMEGKPIDPEPNTVVGRWAGDEVYLVGDYDSSELFEESFGYRNISRQLAETWNDFIEIKDMQLKYDPDCKCETRAEATV